MKHKKFSTTLVPVNVLSFLLQEERRSGVLLVLAAVLALFLANSPWSDVYFGLIDKRLTLGAITLDVQHWISEGLMVLFFLVVTLEVKREFIDGELRTWRKASFPVIAAAGGMIVPASIYALLNPYQPQSMGWAIPIATDIAIAIGVLALLGKRVPKNLRIFLLALAIIDDIGSIVIIGVFYSQPTNALALIGAITLSLVLLVLRRQRLWLVSFLIVGFCMWYCLLLAGISGTMAGVILAGLAPLTRRSNRSILLQFSEKVEDALLPLTAYVVVPLFVFSSAGLVINTLSLTQENGLMVFAGVAAGLLIGKPLGIVSASWVAAKLQLTHKPKDLSWTHIIGAGFIAGIGFTISLLIADLSFSPNPKFQNAAIFGVFVASLLAGLAGVAILGNASNKKTT
ncbi:MAG TPA: Na+/H+ antiporter NhaA [Candidatus Limnocylindria bacterium]|nr:Na+/H+ antiporter NhaA [Candidatus Limnocylindria bacterium]